VEGKEGLLRTLDAAAGGRVSKSLGERSVVSVSVSVDLLLVCLSLWVRDVESVSGNACLIYAVGGLLRCLGTHHEVLEV
jgi:hypothetical protein